MSVDSIQSRAISVKRLALVWMSAAWIIAGPGVHAQTASSCAVAEFRRIGLTVANPTERTDAAKAWLVSRGPSCDINQLNLLQSNLAGWLGSALTGEITVMVEGLQEAKLSKDPAKLQELFNPAVKTFEPSVEVTTNPRPRPPVVNANPSPGAVVGGVVGMPPPVLMVPPPGSAPAQGPAPELTDQGAQKVRIPK